MSKRTKINLNIFIVCLVIYSINRLTNVLYYIPYLSYILRYHFNDYLAGIVFLAYLNIILGLSKYQHIRVLKWSNVIFTGLLIGVFWEYITPIYKSDSTSDIIDVICYVLGAISYKVIYNFTMLNYKKGRNHNENKV